MFGPEVVRKQMYCVEVFATSLGIFGARGIVPPLLRPCALGPWWPDLTTTTTKKLNLLPIQFDHVRDLWFWIFRDLKKNTSPNCHEIQLKVLFVMLFIYCAPDQLLCNTSHFARAFHDKRELLHYDRFRRWTTIGAWRDVVPDRVRVHSGSEQRFHTDSILHLRLRRRLRGEDSSREVAQVNLAGTFLAFCRLAAFPAFYPPIPGSCVLTPLPREMRFTPRVGAWTCFRWIANATLEAFVLHVTSLSERWHQTGH